MSKKKTTSNIVHLKTSDDNLVVKSDTQYYSLEYYKNDFVDEKFIKAVEKLVRKSDEYSQFLAFIANEYGLNHCAVHPNIANEEDDKDTLVEMHHGPIFTLYDICDIITRYMLANGKKVSTFSVADRVLKEHGHNNVQVIMLCENCHQMTHQSKLFINLKQAYGNLPRFIEKYGEYMDAGYRTMYNKYIEQDKVLKTTDSGFLVMSGIESWNIQKKEDKPWRSRRMLDKYKEMD